METQYTQAAADMSGRKLWTRNLAAEHAKFDINWGPASSPAVGGPNFRQSELLLPAASLPFTSSANEGGLAILSGHLDVVPAGDPATWTTDPWAAEIRDGRLYPCAYAAFADVFRERFGIEGLKVSPADSISIRGDADPEKVIDFLRHPIPWCANCDMNSREFFEWGRSKREITEWTKSDGCRPELP